MKGLCRFGLAVGVCWIQAAAGQDAVWKTLAPGLDWSRLAAGVSASDTIITVLRVDPEFWEFHLLCASEEGFSKGLSAREWCRRYHLTAAVNAGMYQQDGRTNVGYMQNFNHLNNPSVHPRHLSAAAFNPRSPQDAPFFIYDLDDTLLSQIRKRYQTIIQNLRLIKRPRRNVWQPKPESWSEAALGQDIKGRMLLIYSPQPMSMAEFNDKLLNLPLDITAAQHLEGGAEAQLYIVSDSLKLDKTLREEVSAYNAGYINWLIPNVIGLKPKRIDPLPIENAEKKP